MKTFTNYAEKKAKQFLNLLQGYTKGIRITAILILLLMGVNNAWGDNNVKVYCAIKASDLNCYTLKVNANIGDNNTWRQYTMEKLDETYEGRLIYQATIVEKYGGVDALQFQLYEGSTWKSQKQPYSTWTTSSTFANKLYVYDTNNWITKTNDPSYTVYFVNKDDWTGTIKAYAWNSDCDKNKDWSGADMTSTGKTYKGKNIYSITLNKQYANIIFNNGSSQTGDLTLGSTNIEKMYDGSNWVDYNVDPVVTFKANGGTGSDYTQTVKYNTSTALTANTFTRTGYSFNGWKTAANSGTSYADKANVTFKANTTLYAQWTAKNITINWNANGGSVTPTSSTYTYDGDAITLPTPSYAGHRFLGWFTAANGGTQITDVGTTNKPYTTVTYYAHWEVSIVEHTVTFAVGTGSTEYGTLTAATNSGNITSGSNIVEGTSVTFTATPKTGYEVEGWYTNAACTEGKHDAGSTTYTTTITAATYVYVKFVEKTWSVAFAAGTGGSVTTPSSTPQTVGQITGISIAATPATGYTFNQWTITSGSGSFTSAATTNSNKFKPTNNSTVTASFNETMSTLTTSNKYDVGNPEYAIPTKSVNSIGVVTTATVKATAAGNGYTFTGWTLTNCTRTDNGATNATSITVRSNGDGKAATVVANYAEDCNTTWVLAHSIDNFNTSSHPFVKKSGESTGKVAYVSLDLAADTEYTFKVKNGNKWYGNNNSNEQHWIKQTVENWDFWDDAGDCHMKTNVADTYTFKIDFSGANPKVSVYFPTSYTVTYSRVPEAAADAPTTDPSITSGALVLSGTSMTFTAKDANTGYAWKGWYDNSEGTGTALSTNKAYTRTINADTEIYAVYTEILSTITIVTNSAEGGSIEVDGQPFTPGNTVQVGVATFKLVTAVPNEGYGVAAWGVSNKDIVNASGGATVTLKSDGSGSTGTLYANFIGLEYTITFNKQEGTNGTDKATVRYKNNEYSVSPVVAPTRAGYTFGGYYTQAAGAGVQVVSAEGQWLANATGYTDAEGKWVKADNVTLYAKWTESQVKHNVLILYMCGDVVVKAEETIEVGEILPTSITAPTVTGYTFSNWKLGDGLVTTDNLSAYTINLKTKPSGDYTLTANYIKYQYTLKFGVLGYGGSVSAIADGNEIASPAPLGQDTEVTLTATAKDGYEFYNWIDANGNEVSKVNPYVHTMTASTTINAVFKNTRMLYLRLNDKWSRELGNGVWFAAYFFNTSNENYWVKMSTEAACNNNGIYKTPIPEGNWTNVIFVRMNKDNQTWLSFDNKWDKTVDLTIPKDGKNLFTLSTGHEGESCNGTWSTHNSTYKPTYLTYNVEVPAGTPNCYISGEINGWSFTEMEKVDDTHYTITIQDACPDDEYKYCYGPSWGCQEVKKSDYTAIDNRKYSADDKVEAWIKYCIVGQDLGNWDWIDHFEFDLDGDINSLTHHLNQNTNGYKFKVKSSIGEYYTTDNQDGDKHIFHSMHTSEKIPQTAGNWHELILKVDVAGDHHFLFDPVSKLLTIEFPEKGYRLKITMTDGSGKVYTSNAVNNENETLSFFAPGANDTKLKGTITLEHEGQAIAGFTPPTITESGVYTAKLNSDKKSITTPVAYSGNYYIRTDGANGGWSNYKTDSDNKMTYFVPREEEKYSYYWVQALPRAPRDASNGVVNVKACVANDYNDNLAVMLEADKFTSDAYGNVNILDPDEHHREKINVRFGYNPNTNHFERAMLTGSGNINTFLNITDPEGRIYKTNNNGTLETQLIAASKDNKFTDISNWVYERDIWVEVPESEDVTVCLTAVSYNGARNSLFGFIDADQKVPTQRTIVGAGSTQGQKKMRVIYDFKTNRMIMAWMPGEYECKGDQVLNSDVLFLRHENELVPQLTLEQNAHITGIQSQFFALEFENKGNANYEEHYWFTLPFDCVVGSISGVPGYMSIWGIQRYNGTKRAEKGWFKETETFWEWMKPDDVMEAGVGYVLSFDKSAATWNTFDVHTENPDGSVTTTQRSLLRLYFPSTTEGFTFQSTNSFEKEYPNEPCTIQTADRYKQDGNWKIIGPLSYNSATATPKYDSDNAGNVWKPEKDSAHIDVPDVPEGKYSWSAPMFLYEFWQDDSDRSDWKYIVRSTINHRYQAFYGYMVQYAGTIEWSEISQSIQPKLRARTYTDQVPTNITTNLELLDASGRQHDQTFVSLDIEGTTTFDLNKDLNKVFNSNFSNIYTLSEDIPFAGNTLPMEKATVPVGVRIATAGEYTFRMPDGTEGINVTLIDNQTGTQTDMLMSEYTVTLDAGTIENRFYLVVDPDRTATSVENIGEEAKGEEAKDQIKKFLIDGKLFIRTADGIFDAKGQRL